MSELYDRIGKGYCDGRKVDPYIASAVHGHLRQAQSILNLGAGTGSYEEGLPGIVALEPSLIMLQQRQVGAAPAVCARADKLPFSNACFSHALGILTLHHWQNRQAAFEEIKRVVRERFVTLTWCPESPAFWLVKDYLPQVYAHDVSIFPSQAELKNAFTKVDFYPLPIPANCKDGFLAAYWARPKEYLKQTVREGISTFSKIKNFEVGLQKLQDDIDNGLWSHKYHKILEQPFLDVGYKIAVCEING